MVSGYDEMIIPNFARTSSIGVMFFVDADYCVSGELGKRAGSFSGGLIVCGPAATIWGHPSPPPTA